MKLLITGAWQEAQKYFSKIESLGHEIVFLQYEKDQLPCPYEWVEGVVGNNIFLYHPIERFSNLMYIQLTSAGLDRIPLEYANEHGIKLNNARHVYSVPMAEHVISGVLDLYRKRILFLQNQKTHKWEKIRNLKELQGQKVCILGCGSVGTECAKRFQAFNCIVIGIDINVTNVPYFQSIYGMDNMEKIISESDIIVLTLPLTEQTKHMFNERLFNYVKDNAVIVNIARGALVDTDSLINALKNKLYGAVLDVFEEEPLNENSPLWDMENVVITPHNSFVGNHNAERLSELIIMNLTNSMSEELQ